MTDIEPPINISQTELTNAGFTVSGSDRYNKSVKEYGKILFDKAVNYGDIDKASNTNREVTHEHVKASAHSIANSFGKPVKSRWIIPIQVGEFLCAGIVGLCSGHIDKKEGIIGFAIAFAIGAILFMTEKTISK
jgi:uncharacterized membrane protein YjjP (DUF1212 family)